MKKLLAVVLALALCLGMCSLANAETYKVGLLTPAVTHGWVGGITYLVFSVREDPYPRREEQST